MHIHTKKRSGFAMIMAIFFMIVIATLLSYMLSSTTETAKRTTNIYVNEQAQLLAKSAVEYAILAVSGHDRTVGCINTINSHYPATNPLFDIRVDIQYYGFGLIGGWGCNTLITGVTDTIATPESNGTMMIDVYVTSSTGVGGLNLSEPIRYHRRTLQKL